MPVDNALLQVSIFELMRLWAELVECYHGVNGYGGTVAEIYAYRFQRYSPAVHEQLPMSQFVEESNRQTANALYTLVELFCKEYVCGATIDDQSIDAWHAQCQLGQRVYDWRVHVEIVREAN